MGQQVTEIHAAELKRLQASHEKAIAELSQQHSASQEAATSSAKALKDAEAALKAELAKTNDALSKAQAELDSLKQDFALEKMAKAEAQAELDSALNKKPDTSEVDGLRKELQALKDQHQASLMTAQQESAQATEEHLATKSALAKVTAELERQKAESTSDFNDMHESLTQLAEEANKKSTDLEARTKELEALLKVKDAELAASRYAEDTDAPKPEVKTEAEGEHDSSSA